MAGTVETLHIEGQQRKYTHWEEPTLPPVSLEEIAAVACLWTSIIGFFSGAAFILGTAGYVLWGLFS